MVKRKVWEKDNGSRILSVNGLLSEGDYTIRTETDGNAVILKCSKQD